MVNFLSLESQNCNINLLLWNRHNLYKKQTDNMQDNATKKRRLSGDNIKLSAAMAASLLVSSVLLLFTGRKDRISALFPPHQDTAELDSQTLEDFYLPENSPEINARTPATKISEQTHRTGKEKGNTRCIFYGERDIFLHMPSEVAKKLNFVAEADGIWLAENGYLHTQDPIIRTTPQIVVETVRRQEYYAGSNYPRGAESFFISLTGEAAENIGDYTTIRTGNRRYFDFISTTSERSPKELDKPVRQLDFVEWEVMNLPAVTPRDFVHVVLTDPNPIIQELLDEKGRNPIFLIEDGGRANPSSLAALKQMIRDSEELLWFRENPEHIETIIAKESKEIESLEGRLERNLCMLSVCIPSVQCPSTFVEAIGLTVETNLVSKIGENFVVRVEESDHSQHHLAARGR